MTSSSTGQAQAAAVDGQAIVAQAVESQAVESQAVESQAVESAVGTQAAETQPSAGAASPSGMVKPPPLTPLPHYEQTPSPPADPPADPPAVGPIDGNAAMVSPDDDTAPLPVILPDRVPESVAQEARMRDPFEPIERPPSLPRRVPQSEHNPNSAQASSPLKAPRPPKVPSASKMDQIKDLYLTAEAIGEDALTQHFQQVSDRQRQLIKEYFDQIAAHGDGQTKS